MFLNKHVMHAGSIQESCDCCFIFASGGCVVCQAAPANRACRCSYGWFECVGTVVDCKWGLKSANCQNPDTSLASCVEGDGNCEGYD